MGNYLDYNGLLYFWSKIKTKLGDKVDKITGKGLSTEDFTTAYKTKLDGIAENANKYIHPDIGTAGTYGDESDTRTLEHSGTFNVVVVTTDAQGHVSSIETKTLTLPAGYVLPDATTAKKGGVIVGDGLSVSSGKISVATAPKLETERTISLTGDATGSATFDGSANAIITVTVVDDSHNHVIDNVDGLQDALDLKLSTELAENTYAKKSDITTVFRYKGSKDTVTQLPTSGNTTGDVWDVKERGINYVWNGTEWDPLGELFTIPTLTNTEIDTILAF